MLCIDFGPDFELRMWCRHSTIERGQELARTRRAVDASRDDALTPARWREAGSRGSAPASLAGSCAPASSSHHCCTVLLTQLHASSSAKPPHTKPHHDFHVAAHDLVLALRGLLTDDRALKDQPALAALLHRERARAAPVAMLQIRRSLFKPESPPPAALTRPPAL
jgi:hypothetical protein